MDNIKFGRFITNIRKEKKMTQKQLAEKLHLTDKAVSKWERGLSFPDITILNSLAEVLDVDITELLNGERGCKEKINVDKAIKDAIEEVNKTNEKRTNKILKIKKITGIISIMAFILALILQCTYLFILRRHGYEYVIDSMLYIVNQIILICGAVILLIYIKKNRIKNLITWFLLIVLSVINIAFMVNNGFNKQGIVDFSRDFSNQLVLKRDKKSGETYFYRDSKILFAKPREQFSYAVDGKLKRKWLTNDICSITYEDTEGILREFVATYGDRGNGNSYYYVANAILGDWQVFTQNGNSTKMIVDSKGITIKKQGKSELYEYGDTKQFGTISLVLYKGDIPKYVIALNEDCKLNEKTEIIEKGGTITLFEISMDKTIPETLSCITYKGNVESNTYNVVSMDPYSYKIKNGILYIRYESQNIIEVPGEYSNMIDSYNKYNYQISNEKTVFFNEINDKRYLIYSDDMGKTWNKTEISADGSIENIHFINSNIGFMLRFKDIAMSYAYGVIEKTTDGGKTWEIISNGIEGIDYGFSRGSQIRFFSEEIGFLTIPKNGLNCKLYITKDGGKSFEEVRVTLDNLNNRKEDLNWEDIYDYYNLPTMKEEELCLKIEQGEDGDYNGGDSVIYYSNDMGKSWYLNDN